MRAALRALAALAPLALALNLWLALVVAPPAANFSAPLSQRLFYFHVPAAFASYAAFALAALASLRYLLRREARWDRLALSAAEVGALLTTLALFTGVVWSRVEFFSAGSLAGTSFTFALLGDPKFVTTAAMWLVLLGYLALRRGLDEPERRARLAAAYALLGFLAVPLSYLSSRFSPHPDFLARGSSLAPGMAMLLAACTALWFVLLAALLAHRLALEEGLAQRAEPPGAPLGAAEGA